jgi:hypothetical protein
MSRLLVGGVVAGLALAAAPPRAAARENKVEITRKWSGSVEDEKAIQPECITSSKGIQAVWKAWKVKGDVPKVDFSRHLVVAVYSPGSRLNLSKATLDDQGDLTVVGLGTRDIRPGFRYVLGVVSREGVKTVNKKALPKQ